MAAAASAPASAAASAPSAKALVAPGCPGLMSLAISAISVISLELGLAWALSGLAGLGRAKCAATNLVVVRVVVRV